MEGNRGCAVLNDSKYGVNVLDNSINLTLLRAPLTPDMTTHCTLQTTLPVTAAQQTDMLEEHGTPLALQDGNLALYFRPFEIQTIRLKGDQPNDDRLASERVSA